MKILLFRQICTLLLLLSSILFIFRCSESLHEGKMLEKKIRQDSIKLEQTKINILHKIYH